MNKYYQQLSDYLKTLSLREKVLMLFVGIAVIYFAWDFTFFSAYTKQNKAHQSEVNAVQEEAAEIDNQFAAITKKLVEQGHPNQALKKQIAEVTNDIAEVEEQLTDTFNSLVPPKEVTNFIRSLLLNNANIELISLNNEPVQVIDISSENNPTPDESKDTAVLYQHATNIKLKADYVSLFNYLSKLEQSEWTLYWDQLEYKVENYPTAEVSLRVYTLSTDQHWLGL